MACSVKWMMGLALPQRRCDRWRRRSGVRISNRGAKRTEPRPISIIDQAEFAPASRQAPNVRADQIIAIV